MRGQPDPSLAENHSSLDNNGLENAGSTRHTHEDSDKNDRTITAWRMRGQPDPHLAANHSSLDNNGLENAGSTRPLSMKREGHARTITAWRMRGQPNNLDRQQALAVDNIRSGQAPDPESAAGSQWTVGGAGGTHGKKYSAKFKFPLDTAEFVPYLISCQRPKCACRRPAPVYEIFPREFVFAALPKGVCQRFRGVRTGGCKKKSFGQTGLSILIRQKTE